MLATSFGRTHIVDGASEAGQKPQDGKADAEARPETELSLKLWLVAQCYEDLLIGCVLVVVAWDFGTWKD